MIIGSGDLPTEAKEIPPEKYIRFLDLKPPIGKQYISPEEYYQSAIDKLYIFPQATIRHEFGHLDVDKTGELRLTSEANANIIALQRLNLAKDALFDGDDSLYYFVFQTDQGIIISHKLLNYYQTA
jgi:hypothetical protein